MLPARRVPRLQHLSCIPCPESKAGCPKGQDSNLLGQAHRCRTVCGGASHQSVTLNLSGAATVFPCARIQEPDSSSARGLSAPPCRSFFPSQQAIRTSLRSGERPERDLNPSVLLVRVPAALWLRNRCLIDGGIDPTSSAVIFVNSPSDYEPLAQFYEGRKDAVVLAAIYEKAGSII